MRLGDNEDTENRFGKLMSPLSSLTAAEAVSQLEQLLDRERHNNELLTHAVHEAQQSLGQMEDMLAIASHDLKSPLSAILLNVQSILHAPQPLPTSLRARLQRVEELVRQSAQLVSDILSVERGNKGAPPMKPEAIDLKAFIHSTMASFKEQLEASGCSVLVSAPGSISGVWDRVCLTQIVTNLLSNAIKYGKGNPLEIVLEQQDDDVLIVIADKGIGLAVADQQRIFERFEQLCPTDPWSGSGLGLWIVNKAAERMGGLVQLHSAPGGGATFVVHLPRIPIKHS